jgi:hypothetical protein
MLMIKIGITFCRTVDVDGIRFEGSMLFRIGDPRSLRWMLTRRVALCDYPIMELVSSYPLKTKRPALQKQDVRKCTVLVSPGPGLLADDAPPIHGVEAARLLLLLETVPEAQSLVTSARDDDLAVGTHGEIENSIRMAGERDNLLHVGILPDDDLVLGVSVRRDNLIAVLGPSQITDLAPSVKAPNQIGGSGQRGLKVARSGCRRSR